MKKSLPEVCYACGSKHARPRNIGGTRYFLCDLCYAHHVWANHIAVEYLRNKGSDNGDDERKKQECEAATLI
ncbi:MAG: hypothetical protein WBI48_04675 [Thermacetogeniaceae bacterium]